MSNKRKITDYMTSIKRRALPAAERFISNVAGQIAADYFTRVGNQAVHRTTGTQTQTKTQSKMARIKGGLSHLPRKRFKKGRKCAAINSKPQKKAVKKFQRKVMKAIAHTKCYGEYIYLGSKQLRQIVLDSYGVFWADKNGQIISIGDARAAVDAYSVCFNGKAMNRDFQITGDNIDKRTTFNTVFETLGMVFKSTSTHVCNVEVYECIPKTHLPGNQTPQNQVSESFNDYTNRYAYTNTSSETHFDAGSMGTQARHFTSLYQFYTVKKHFVRLLPGASSSLTFSRKASLYDQSKMQDVDENITPIKKGASYFFFRVINDATVSGVAAPGEPSCYHWPSNNQGGVSLRYTRTIRVVPNNLSVGSGFADEKPAIVIGNWVEAASGQVDQQVVYQAPFKLAEVAQ